MGAPLSTADPALERYGRHTHWLLRAAMASVFLYQGVDKFLGSGITGFAAVMELPVALAEIGAGVLVLLGAFAGGWITRLGAALAVPVLLGAIFMEHWGQWHFMATPTHPLGGMQFQVTLLLLALYLMIRGNEV